MRPATPTFAAGLPRFFGRLFTLRGGPGSGWRFALLVLCLLPSLLLLNDAMRNPTRFGEIHTPLITVTIAGLCVLTLLILFDAAQLVRELRDRRPGASLTARMVVIFGLLTITPVAVIYLFSVQFVHRSVDNWLDVRIESTLEDALEASRASLNHNMRERLKQIELLGARLIWLEDQETAAQLDEAYEVLGASELTLMSSQGRTIATSGDTTDLIPALPDTAVLLQVRQNGTYVGLNSGEDQELSLRVVVNIGSSSPGPGETRFIQALFPVAEGVTELEAEVSGAFERYQNLIYLREPVKTSFMLTLSLLLLMSLLSAVWAALFAARRLTDPLRRMADLTRQVAAGDYGSRLPTEGAAEISFLVDSFNDMIRKLAQARDEARESHLQLDEQHAYLEAVLARQSSGVLTTGHERRIVTFNHKAEEILGVSLDARFGTALDALAGREARLAPFTAVVGARIRAAESDWGEEIELDGPQGAQILMCRGTVLPGHHPDEPGHVVVFDDITRLMEAQRSQAWEEVARRLAHEIKNPLTPIQLSAERLRHKYLGAMEGADAQSFDRLTRTIVQQVESLKEMVNAFSKYARTPTHRARPVNLNELVGDVAELYRDERGGDGVRLELADALPEVRVDPGQFRQVLHNLIRNADEMLEEVDGPHSGAASAPAITISTRRVSHDGRDYVETRVSDRGPGISEKVLGRIFEPYVTTKPKGTGLGLAIIRKIVEEHEGAVTAANQPDGGACFTVRLPVEPAAARDMAESAPPPRAAAAGD